MAGETLVSRTVGEQPQGATAPADPCIMVIFGASGDLTKRLLMPALYNLACDGLLPEQFAIVGMAMDELTTDQFRDRMTTATSRSSTRARTSTQRSGTSSSAASTTRRATSATRRPIERLGGPGRPARRRVPGRRQRPLLHGHAAVVFGLISSNLDKAGFKKRPRAGRASSSRSRSATTWPRRSS